MRDTSISCMTLSFYRWHLTVLVLSWLLSCRYYKSWVRSRRRTIGDWFSFFLWPQGMWDLSSLSRIEPMPPAQDLRGLNHWTAKEITDFLHFQGICIYVFRPPRWLSGKESTCQCRRRGFHSWTGKIPWRRTWQPTPVLLLGKSHGQRSLSANCPWSHKESDTT